MASLFSLKSNNYNYLTEYVHSYAGRIPRAAEASCYCLLRCKWKANICHRVDTSLVCCIYLTRNGHRRPSDGLFGTAGVKIATRISPTQLRGRFCDSRMRNSFLGVLRCRRLAYARLSQAVRRDYSAYSAHKRR